MSLILGAGFSGTAIAKAFLPLAQSVTGTTRSQDKARRRLRERGIDALVYDGVDISPELAVGDGANDPPGPVHRAGP